MDYKDALESVADRYNAAKASDQSEKQTRARRKPEKRIPDKSAEAPPELPLPKPRVEPKRPHAQRPWVTK